MDAGSSGSAFFIVIIIGAYTAGWFWLAGRIDRETQAALARLEERGLKAECANPTVRGYPFRIGLYCDRVAFAQPAQAFSAAAGAFRSAGQIYDPMRLVAELDSPATVSVPGGGQVALDWQTLRASTRLTRTLPERVSLEGTQLRIGANGKPHLVSAGTFEAHMRPNEADLDLAASFGRLVFDPSLVGNRTVPPLTGEADLSVKDGLKLLAENRGRNLRGQSGIVRKLTLQLGDKGALTPLRPVLDRSGRSDRRRSESLDQRSEGARSLAGRNVSRRGEQDQAGFRRPRFPRQQAVAAAEDHQGQGHAGLHPARRHPAGKVDAKPFPKGAPPLAFRSRARRSPGRPR